MIQLAKVEKTNINTISNFMHFLKLLWQHFDFLFNSRSGTEAFWKTALVGNFLKIISLKSTHRFSLLETRRNSVNMSLAPSIQIKMEV